MAYGQNPNINLQSQIQDLSRQYQQLLGQPAAFPVQQIPIPAHQIQYVEGIAGARMYQESMQSNSSEIFYKVSKDANGIPSKKIVRCSFSIIDEQADEPTYLTRKDFDDFKEEIRQLLKPQKTTIPTKEAKT